jgi:hypothetical protein
VSEIEPPSSERPPVEPEAGGHAVAAAEPHTGLSLAQVTWSVTAFVFVLAGALLLAEGYYGYAIVTLAVAASAAINVF